MADWSILRTAGKDYLSPLSYNTHDAALAKFHMMSSFIDSLSPSSIYDENTFCTGDNIEDCITHLNAVSFSLISRLTRILQAFTFLKRKRQSIFYL